jgi:hypothetical protein
MDHDYQWQMLLQRQSTPIWQASTIILSSLKDLEASPRKTTRYYKKVWHVKSIPHFLKTFTWHLIHRALAMDKRVARYSSHIDKHCTSCGAIENDAHIFFLCDLPKQIWTASSTPLTPHLIT